MLEIIRQIFTDKKHSRNEKKENNEQRSSIKIDKTCKSSGILIVLDNDQVLPRTLSFVDTHVFSLTCRQRGKTTEPKVTVTSI